MALRRLRARLRLRERFRDQTELKRETELRWWLEHWDPVLREGGFNPGDAGALLGGEAAAETYEGRRWQQARAEVARVLAEAGIEDERFFAEKVVLDVGPGPLGFPDACPARICIGVDPLAERYRRHGLLLEGSRALYLAVSIESLPLVAESVDVVVCRNSLDHVEDPSVAMAQIRRVMRPGGELILGVDLDHAATAAEPHSFGERDLERLLEGFEVLSRSTRAASGPGARAAVIVARRA